MGGSQKDLDYTQTHIPRSILQNVHDVSDQQFFFWSECWFEPSGLIFCSSRLRLNVDSRVFRVLIFI